MTQIRKVLPVFALLWACKGEIYGGQSAVKPVDTAVADEVGAWPTHLLTATEYNTTVADLLGSTSRPADFFPATSATEFDANVGVLDQMSPVQGEALFEAAHSLTDEVFASPALTARIVTCTDENAACPRSIIAAFGRRAWRRTLDADEVDGLFAVYTRARTDLTLSHVDAVAHVVRVMLSSPSMFMRVERTPLEPSALASRLSYLLWSSGPDDELLTAAESGSLTDDAALLAQADRLLAHANGQRFIGRFLGQWLGFARFSSHAVDPTLFPQWNDAIAEGAATQANDFLNGFVTGGQPWSAFLNAPHPQNAAIAPLLKSDPTDVRKGYLTLPAFLTLTSHSDRTSPTSRAKAIIASLMCTNLSPPPGVVTSFTPDPSGNTTPKTVREQLEAHRASPTCAGCHDMLDPIGLSLENFDAIGEWRTKEGTEPIDASGTYQGTSFTDLRGLLPVLERDPRLDDCAPRKLYAYALRRSLGSDDEAAIAALTTDWSSGPLTVLLHSVVKRPAFRGAQEAKQ